ncbi:dUTP diphosphatase [Cloacibacillus sp. An23]|uniref:dUTP diphosphatase n=1 Tax=Cloacibacillus sp. An23 TaxID=1965591 RepID=UPI000B38BDC9|nr:dUTP diphosphatase [Cloacibacillus sp. An23]OUO90952.1 deoxyuridine 5'-triphosphate nucleotidohydrolase [Cloacibacillus sp. An23]
MDVIKVKVKAADGVTPPAYATPGASGMDLRASEAAVIKAGKRGIVGTGIYIELPEGCEAQVRPRSGLALKHGVSVLNAPGTIDSDYRGEIRVILINLGEEDFAIEPGDRIAQMVFAPVAKAELEIVSELGCTERAEGGFGSTGRK